MYVYIHTGKAALPSPMFLFFLFTTGIFLFLSFISSIYNPSFFSFYSPSMYFFFSFAVALIFFFYFFFFLLSRLSSFFFLGNAKRSTDVCAGSFV